MALRSSCCAPPLRNILFFGVLLVCCSLSSADTCSGYSNLFGTWISSFSCPGLFDSWDSFYCCGDNNFKYCCNEIYDRAIQESSDWNNWDDDWDDGAAAVGTAIAIAWWIWIAIVIGVLSAIFLPVIICCCVCGAASSGSRSRRGGTTVISAGGNAVAPQRQAPIVVNNAVSTVSGPGGMHGMGMSMSYPAPPPSYNQGYIQQTAYHEQPAGQYSGQYPVGPEEA